MTDTKTRSDAAYRMELYLRSFAPSGASDRQRAVMEDLYRLHREGVAEADVTVWGGRISPRTAAVTEEGRNYLDAIEAFRRWEAESDASLNGAFDERTSETLVEEPHPVVVPPTMCLAVYEDDDLWGVFPCTRDGEDRTVADCLDSFLRAGAPETPTDLRERRATRADD